MEFLDYFNDFEKQVTIKLKKNSNNQNYDELILVSKEKINPFLNIYKENKQYIGKKSDFSILKSNIEKYKNIKFIEIFPFRNIQELELCLNKDKEYVLINTNIYTKISSKSKTPSTLKCLIKVNLINIIFDQNNVLKFKTDNLIINKGKILSNEINKPNELIENNTNPVIGFEQYNINPYLTKQNINYIMSNKQKRAQSHQKMNKEINNYSKYKINERLLNLIKLFFYYKKLQQQINFGKFYKNNYYLIDEKWIRKYKKKYDYYLVEKELNSNPFFKEIIQDYSNDNNLKNELELKKIELIINNMSEDLNKYYNSKNFQKNNINNEVEEPNIETFIYINENNSQISFFYYNKFELIKDSIYKESFDHLNKVNNNSNFCECHFVDQLIIIRLKSNFTGINNKIIYEVGNLNKENIFTANYILIYDKEIMINHINNINETVGLKTFLSTLQFNNTNFIPIYDIDSDQRIGFVCKIEEINNQNIMNNENINSLISFNSDYNKNNNEGYNNINYSNNNIFISNDNNNINSNYYTDIEENISINNEKDTGQSIRTNFNTPFKIGLHNVGATCYMNATLQCLCQIEKLVDYFKYKPDSINKIIAKNKLNYPNTLTCSFKYVIENLWPTKPKYTNNNDKGKNSNNSYYCPNLFKKKISEMDPLFQGVHANDAKDLVNFIIMTLHGELNKVNDQEIINDPELNQQNQMVMLKYFAQKFTKENQSIISDIFYAMNGSSIQCSKCKVIKYNYQAYFFLIFPLEEVRKFKVNYFQQQYMQNNQNIIFMNQMLYQQTLMNYQNIDSVNIYDCFNFISKSEIMEGENSVYCNNCNQTLPFLINPFLVTGPEVLIIILNRGKGIEFNVKMEFYLDLKLASYIQMKDTGVNYKLIGVVTHMGLSDATGHFIACCKSPIDDKWYKYKDDIVTSINNVKEEIIDYAMPYILFYQKY